MMLKIVHTSPANQLNNIFRFNGERINGQRESVTQHSYWVTFYCHFIVEQLFSNHVNDTNNYNIWYLEFYRLLNRMALLHDFEESITSDIPYQVKHDEKYGDKMNDILVKIVRDYVTQHRRKDITIEEFALALNVDRTTPFPGQLLKFDLAKIIVKISDWLSCYSFSREQRLSGAINFLRIEKLCLEHIAGKLQELILFLSNNFPQVPSYNKEFIYEFKSELSDLQTDRP